MLIRDPRDIAVSWFYYRCFKTYNSQLNRLAKIRHPGRLAKARADFEAAYHICDAMRADPDAVWNASVESAAQVRWNSTNTVMSGQTLESVVGQATSFYCDFLRSTQAVRYFRCLKAEGSCICLAAPVAKRKEVSLHAHPEAPVQVISVFTKSATTRVLIRFSLYITRIC